MQLAQPQVNAAPRTSTYSELQDTISPELVIALCSPIGTPVHNVAEMLRKLLGPFNYDCQIRKMSDFIKELESLKEPNDEYQRKKQLITKGDELRERLGPSILAEKAIKEISEYRLRNKSTAEVTTKHERVVFVIDSIKNQAEMDLLKLVYGRACYCIGAFSPLSQRVKNLMKGKASEMTEQQAFDLIELDSGDKAPNEKKAFSQTVQKTFAKADLFLRMDTNSSDKLETKLLRFLHLVFRTKVITPAPNEAAMFAAASAASNSGCLSRQVGASVTDEGGELISVGWNDVPAPGGGLYTSTSVEDNRCANKAGGCQNTEEKGRLVKRILNKIEDGKIDVQQIEKILSNSQISSLIEYCRAIHAEMYAIIQAGKKGLSMKSGNLYCTTYPCHACARHIVATGISNVYYIEPYTKSMAIHLHDDALTEDEGTTKKVRLLAFDGVAPNRYLELFSQQNRKDQKQVSANGARPTGEISLEAVPTLEGLVVTHLKKRLEYEDEGKQIPIGFVGQATTPAA